MITFNKECKTPDELRNSSKLPYLMFDVDMPIDDILKEIGNAQQHFYTHREDQSKVGVLLVMHGMGDDKTNSPEYYNVNEEDAVYDWTDASDSIPT